MKIQLNDDLLQDVRFELNANERRLLDQIKVAALERKFDPETIAALARQIVEYILQETPEESYALFIHLIGDRELATCRPISQLLAANIITQGSQGNLCGLELDAQQIEMACRRMYSLISLTDTDEDRVIWHKNNPIDPQLITLHLGQGCVVKNLSNHFFSTLVHGLEELHCYIIRVAAMNFGRYQEEQRRVASSSNPEAMFGSRSSPTQQLFVQMQDESHSAGRSPTPR